MQQQMLHRVLNYLDAGVCSKILGFPDSLRNSNTKSLAVASLVQVSQCMADCHI